MYTFPRTNNTNIVCHNCSLVKCVFVPQDQLGRGVCQVSQVGQACLDSQGHLDSLELKVNLVLLVLDHLDYPDPR